MDISSLGMPKYESTSINLPLFRRDADFAAIPMNVSEDSLEIEANLWKVPDRQTVYHDKIIVENNTNSSDKLKRVSSFDEFIEVPKRGSGSLQRKILFENSIEETNIEQPFTSEIKRKSIFDGTLKECSMEIENTELRRKSLNDTRFVKILTKVRESVLTSKKGNDVRKTVYSANMEESLGDISFKVHEVYALSNQTVVEDDQKFDEKNQQTISYESDIKTSFADYWSEDSDDNEVIELRNLNAKIDDLELETSIINKNCFSGRSISLK